MIGSTTARRPGPAPYGRGRFLHLPAWQLRLCQRLDSRLDFRILAHAAEFLLSSSKPSFFSASGAKCTYPGPGSRQPDRPRSSRRPGPGAPRPTASPPRPAGPPAPPSSSLEAPTALDLTDPTAAPIPTATAGAALIRSSGGRLTGSSGSSALWRSPPALSSFAAKLAQYSATADRDFVAIRGYWRGRAFALAILMDRFRSMTMCTPKACCAEVRCDDAHRVGGDFPQA